jgi:hypothetical protein
MLTKIQIASRFEPREPYPTRRFIISLGTDTGEFQKFLTLLVGSFVFHSTLS